jgi:hypothetical protein
LVIWGNNLIQCFREPRSTLGGARCGEAASAITAQRFSSNPMEITWDAGNPC